ncbi:similar to Saccharomyces cerevisiae YDR214W AHA1 Co-chaperone that binds to Hsp82p and activates its ATPase activity [Maudiozyma barnettii]|uniref:Similar to Saccharomyces cerevisiae YDR214W AHA1 Co-chaperone that binds to Hsp82p and activates its ATPase activity n=1 Tax=Maudiozyma barnettii TaxID=61262 RepID=A0A8H2ZI00_9SACH|nr:Aha1p [Kazachstania barnettii]CAB4255017.1 similar to Saccharomyces cerevisiae YDR214W AHA1 Co-chaperone that binds to Hsp82p and activates its ATPase activity [Kazachstania barnettii]CAD1783288.1 similar to Saccharomyces cerevisiae YDR214W AHA1 Co-chaperone that binds to Hsp82p and activates its ATPase activity [Kazachstania barnettii]
MAVQNPNNWHWVDKNCMRWAREYFESKLIGLETNDASSSTTQYVKIKNISSFEGDCEVSQRKGKVISLFDLQMVVLFEGHVNSHELEGSISIPEISFDSEREEYQFDISIYKETSELNEVKPIIREKLLPQMRDIFQQFGKDLLAAQGNDIQVPENQVNSQFTKANQQQIPTSSTTVSTTTSSVPKDVKKQTTSTTTSAVTTTNSGDANRTTIHLEPSFIVPATEIYSTFIDKDRIMAFTRGSVRVTKSKDSNSKKLVVGDQFELFDGNIASELIEANSDKSLTFKWRLSEWPTKVWSTLQMTFHESKEYHETKVQVAWSGIPVGEEDRVRNNFENYYVRPIKLTFGFGVVL